MSRYRFDLATPADDADLRRVLAETPMPGAITVSFRREPSYFHGAVVAGRFHTAALPWAPRPARSPPAGIAIRPACREDLPALLAFLGAAGPRRQFFPRYGADDFFTPGGTFRDLQPEDLLLAVRGGTIV